LQEAEKNNYYKGELNIRHELIRNYGYKSDYKSAEENSNYLSQFIKLSKDSADFAGLYGSYGGLGVLISVKDNGNGIPQNIVDKIFQPFFTTKPTGQGTGLGLSLSYDIIKAHSGEIKVETKEGEGSEFIIQLAID
jgi:signal transduction histidine kinase